MSFLEVSMRFLDSVLFWGMVILSMGVEACWACVVEAKFDIELGSYMCVVCVLWVWFSIVLVWFCVFLCWCCWVFLSIRFLLRDRPRGLG